MIVFYRQWKAKVAKHCTKHRAQATQHSVPRDYAKLRETRVKEKDDRTMEMLKISPNLRRADAQPMRGQGSIPK